MLRLFVPCLDAPFFFFSLLRMLSLLLILRRRYYAVAITPLPVILRARRFHTAYMPPLPRLTLPRLIRVIFADFRHGVHYFTIRVMLHGYAERDDMPARLMPCRFTRRMHYMVVSLFTLWL